MITHRSDVNRESAGVRTINPFQCFGVFRISNALFNANNNPLRPAKNKCSKLLSQAVHFASSYKIALSGKSFILRELITTQSANINSAWRVLWIRRFELEVGDFISYIVPSIFCNRQM